jgi:hypothetical protein
MCVNMADPTQLSGVGSDYIDNNFSNRITQKGIYIIFTTPIKWQAQELFPAKYFCGSLLKGTRHMLWYLQYIPSYSTYFIHEVGDINQLQIYLVGSVILLSGRGWLDIQSCSR